MNYQKLMCLTPTEYQRMTNSKGQVVLFLEHPTKGDEAEVIVAFPELELAFYSGFHECDDMTADHREYEPSVQDGKLFIGDFEA